MAFPASALELSDLGGRIRIRLPLGALVEDTLTGLHVDLVDDGAMAIAIRTHSFDRWVTLDLETSIEYVTGE